MTGSDDSGADKERILRAKYEVWQYRDDGSKFLDDVETVEAVPIAELEQLADEWEETLEWAEEHQEICSRPAINVGERKTRELRQLIADYRGDTDG